MHPVTLTLQLTHPELNDMPKPTPWDWEGLGRELHAVDVCAEEIEAGARKLLEQARETQFADAREQMSLTQKHTRPG